MSSVVTISASYGAGGSWVGPEVAERLGWRFIDRAIPVQVAERLAVPVEHAHIHDEAAAPRFARLLARLPNTSGVVLPEATSPEFCRETERLLIETADAGEVVVLGRAGAIVLRDRPGAFHVRLDGPPEPRVFQGMRVENISENEARRRQRRLRSCPRGIRQALLPHRSARSPSLPPGAQLDRGGAADLRRADRHRRASTPVGVIPEVPPLARAAAHGRRIPWRSHGIGGCHQRLAERGCRVVIANGSYDGRQLPLDVSRLARVLS